MAKLKLGVIVKATDNPEKSIKRVREFNLPTCQISCWDENFLNTNYAKS